MKTKTKMSKAMYGKTMMKKGGAKKSLPKAQYGVAGIGEAVNKAVKGVKASSGPARQAAIADKNTTFPWKSPTGVVYADRKSLESGSPSSKLTLEAAGQKKKGGAVKKSLVKAQDGKIVKTAKKLVDTGAKNIAKAIASSDSYRRQQAIKDPNTKFPYTSSKGVVYENREALRTGQPSSKLTVENLKKMGKMMTGGMVNSNAKVSYQTVAGSKGVTSGVNSKVSASNTASSKGSGRANTPPSKATPAAKRGGAVKMKRGGMIKRK